MHLGQPEGSSIRRVATRAAPGLIAFQVAWLAGTVGTALALQAGCKQAGHTVTCTYATQGSSPTFIVPAGVVGLQELAVGGSGGGGGNGPCGDVCGGRGARVSGLIRVSSGESLDIEVASNANGGTGGSPGGGSSPAGCGGAVGWGGGGYSIVYNLKVVHFIPVVTTYVLAGGGGGDGCGGVGKGTNLDPETQGGDAGQPGGQGTGPDGPGGQPGTPTAGGKGGTAGMGATSGGPGARGQGGNGGAGETAGTDDQGGNGGGGGGGYWGGGGGAGGQAGGAPFYFAGSGGGGGGGSSIVPSGGTMTIDITQKPEVQLAYGLISFTSAAPTAATAHERYAYMYKATGDSGITYKVTAGKLPRGLKLTAGGRLSGTPRAAGTYTYTVTATGATATRSRKNTIHVKPAPKFVLGKVAGVPGGVRFSITCHASGGTICDGFAELTVPGQKPHAKPIVVGQTKFKVAAGKTQKILVKLNAKGRQLLKSSGRLHTTLVVSLLNTSPPAVLRTSVTVT